MKKQELQRLIKLEDRIKELCDEYGLKCMPVEFDVIPPQKMMEILAYHNPTNISNWKYGRDYERLKTIFDNFDPNLPYELVINDNPARAYLMNSNTLAVQALVVAHVYGHVNFFTESKWFQKSRRDIIELMAEAGRRFNEYERIYGIDEVEYIVDAGHALQWHSSPFDEETEKEKKLRVFEQLKKQYMPVTSDFGDILPRNIDPKKMVTDVELANNQLWRKIQAQTPIEPTEDLLRFIIDNSRVLEDWQKDILEILRIEGQYYWPNIKSKYMNEGWATYWHEIIMNRMINEGLLNGDEHGQYNYSNSLVKATNRTGMNPYLIGSTMWKNIKYRWDTGRHGFEYDNCTDLKEKENWDTKEMKGDEKIKEIMKSYTDWFFMQDFLTVNMIDELDLYIYQQVETVASVDYVRTKHTAEQCRELIVNSFANSGIPKIEITNGNLDSDGNLIMIHRYTGIPLDPKYCTETLKHIYRLWRRPITLKTWVKDKNGKDTEKFYVEGNGDKAKEPVVDEGNDYQPFYFKTGVYDNRKVITIKD